MRKLCLLVLIFLCACQPLTPAPSSGFSVIFHPDGGLYVGDQVSLEVIPPDGWDSKDKQVQVTSGDLVLWKTGFGAYGVGQREEATLWWVWDTKGLQPGEHELSFSIQPDGPTWQEQVDLSPAAGMPFANLKWESTTTICCSLYYVSGTEAERDIDLLKTMVDEQAADVSLRMHAGFQQHISITFMPRMLGHGGFASNGIYVSYLDGNIAGNITTQVVHHEMVHILDASLGGEMRPAILGEGLAVYLSGGHYKYEALLPRAAALLEMNSYIPLILLVKDFYQQQHEIGYLEAGALVEYLVDRYGWQAFEHFYRQIPNLDSPEESLEAALEQNFQISLAQLEQDFLSELKKQLVTKTEKEDLTLTIDYFNSMRNYQEVLDPSAYFLTAWVPDGEAMRQKGIVADLVRAPDRLDNRIFEFVLLTANHEISRGYYKNAEIMLGVTNYLLDLYEK
jgi:hypothetical protein